MDLGIVVVASRRVHVPQLACQQIEMRETDRRVAILQIETVGKLVEVPQFQTFEKIVSVIEMQLQEAILNVFVVSPQEVHR